jgi:aspartate/glutamate racemase
MTLPADPLGWFAETLGLSGVAHTGSEPEGSGEFTGRRLGLLNGSSWITPWAIYFGRRFVPGAHLISVGNEAVQINFMSAHERGEPTPPASNIEAFVRYARDLAEFAQVDAILVTCSTMNRSYRAVADAMNRYDVPVVQIDRPMMERAVRHGGKTLVIATHGPTVASTQALLRETAAELATPIAFAGLTVEDAWHRLARGDVRGHNDAIAEAIRRQRGDAAFDSVVLAQLSMSLFLLSFPEPEAEFGVPVFTSAQCGFERAAEVLRRASPRPGRGVNHG